MPIDFDTAYDNTDYSLRNRNYTVLIRQNRDDADDCRTPIVVAGSVSTEFQVGMTSQWESVMNLAGNNEGMARTLSAFGVRAVPQISTMLVWQGGANELEFNLQFEMHAWSNPEKDVVSPLRSLMAMTMPAINKTTGLLNTPGGYLDPESSKDILASLQDGNAAKLLTKSVVQPKMRKRISVAIGRWIYFDNVAITSVNYNLHTDTPFRGLNNSFFGTFETPGTFEGAPMGASVTITFKPMFTMTTDDLKEVFLPSAEGSNAASENAHRNLLNEADAVGLTAASSFKFNDGQMEFIDLYDPWAT